MIFSFILTSCKTLFCFVDIYVECKCKSRTNLKRKGKFNQVLEIRLNCPKISHQRKILGQNYCISEFHTRNRRCLFWVKVFFFSDLVSLIFLIGQCGTSMARNSPS